MAFRWGPSHIWLHTTLEGPWPHSMILESVLGQPLDTAFGLSQFHGHGSWLVCEVALIKYHKGCSSYRNGNHVTFVSCHMSLGQSSSTIQSPAFIHLPSGVHIHPSAIAFKVYARCNGHLWNTKWLWPWEGEIGVFSTSTSSPDAITLPLIARWVENNPKEWSHFYKKNIGLDDLNKRKKEGWSKWLKF